ncbi:MAG TPA: hypothetical protein VGM02_02160 [Acidobacteriaceae bacterium]|jgi:hypothetical protein
MVAADGFAAACCAGLHLKIAAKVVENPKKHPKMPKNTKKTVEIPDLPLTSGGKRPHGDAR